MVDMAILGQAGFWNVNPMDMSVFFHLMAQQIPMLMEADGTVKAAMVGQTYEVLVENETKEKNGMLTGRTGGNINIDFPGCAGLVGTYRRVRVTEAKHWLLTGELAE